MLTLETVDVDALADILIDESSQPHEVEIARKLIIFLAELSHPDAIFSVAMWSIDRDFDFNLTDDDAVLYLEAASASGHYGAAYNLGIMYEIGKIVEVNERLAAEYYLRAAFRGNKKALHEISDPEGIVARVMEKEDILKVARLEFDRLKLESLLDA